MATDIIVCIQINKIFEQALSIVSARVINHAFILDQSLDQSRLTINHGDTHWTDTGLRQVEVG